MASVPDLTVGAGTRPMPLPGFVSQSASATVAGHPLHDP